MARQLAMAGAPAGSARLHPRRPAELRARRRLTVLEARVAAQQCALAARSAGLAATCAALAAATGKLAEARAELDTLIAGALARDDAGLSLANALTGLIAGLQDEVDASHADLQTAVDEIDGQDAHIAELRLALLGERSLTRQ